MSTVDRCAAAHREDHSPCEGPLDAVRVVDQYGMSASGCVRHGAVLLASIQDGRVYPGSVEGAAVETYQRAQQLGPFQFGEGETRE